MNFESSGFLKFELLSMYLKREFVRFVFEGVTGLNFDIFLSLKIVFIIATVKTQIKCHITWPPGYKTFF